MNLKDSPFQKGLYMKVPKGTPLISRWGHDKEVELTKRDVVVEISDTALPSADKMLTIEEMRQRDQRFRDLDAQHAKDRDALCVTVHYPARTVPNGRGGQTYTYEAYDRREIDPEKEAEWTACWKANRKAHDAIVQEYVALGESRFSQDEVMVGWATNNKWAAAKHLEIAEKPEARKKEPKVNLRQQMVPKSRWKFTQDVTITYGAPNPAYHKIVDAWDKANPRPDHRHTNDPVKEKANNASYQQWHVDREAMRQAAQANPGEYVQMPYRVIKAGDIMTVVGKFNSYWNPYGWSGQRYTNSAEVVFDGEKDVQFLEYSMIKDFIEAESIPTVDVWVLRHKPTGKYYLGPDYSKGNYRWKSYYDEDNNLDDGVEAQEMVETFMKGKKWDNLGRAKTSILTITGYYKDLPGADESLPEWGGGGKTFNMTSDWELVKFDKLGRKEIGPVADFHEWFATSWRLRALTVQFGSSVRTAYKALEKANLLDSQKGMIVFTETNEDKLDNAGIYGDKSAISKEEQELINQAIESTKMKKGTYKKATDIKSVAVSFPTKGAAMMFKLAYNGKLKSHVLDLETLTEAVDG